MKSKMLLVLFFTLLLVACKTPSVKNVSEGDTSMYAMVYDYDNMGVANVKIYVGEEYIGESDVQGRFILDLPKREDYNITLKKSGYETVSRDIHFDPFLVLYFKIGNAEQFLYLAEEELDAGNTESAFGYVNRTLSLEENRPDALFLKAVILYKMRRYGESEAILSLMEQKEERLGYIRQLQEKNRAALEVNP